MTQKVKTIKLIEKELDILEITELQKHNIAEVIHDTLKENGVIK